MFVLAGDSPGTVLQPKTNSPRPLGRGYLLTDSIVTVIAFVCGNKKKLAAISSTA